MKIEVISKKISELIPAEYNPRLDLQPGDPEYEKLKRSIKEFGLVEPLVFNKRTGRLVGGHQRLKIIKELGFNDVLVSVVDLDDTQEKALNIALNKIKGDWDNSKLKDILEELELNIDDVTITGFDEQEVEDLLDQFADGSDEDEEKFDLVKALQEIIEPRVKLGEVWQLGDHHLICGDSTDKKTWERLLGDTKVDLVVTSPPYNMGIKYASYKDRKARDEYLEFIRKIGKNMVEFLAPGRFVAWNVGVAPESYPHYHVVILEECGLEFYRQIVWEKVGIPHPLFHNTMRTKKARHYKPNFKHEMIYVLRRNEDEDDNLPLIECPVCDGSGQVQGMVNPITHDVLLLMTWGKLEKGGKIKPTKKYANDVWQIMQTLATKDIPTIVKNKDGDTVKAHPAVFPIELPKAVMTFLTAEEETVLDPFSGAGSTIIAAEQIGRVAYGIEIDPLYAELSIRRWEQFTGQKAAKIE